MYTKLLLPPWFKAFGFILLLGSLALGVLVRFQGLEFDFLSVQLFKPSEKWPGEKINFTDEIALTGVIVALLFISFAREKTEDEFITHTRLESWQWAILTNYILLLVATWAVHGLAYLDVMMYNMLTIPVIFILRFHYVLRKTRNLTENESYEKHH